MTLPIVTHISIIKKLWRLCGYLTGVILTIFTLRRWLFLLTVFFKHPRISLNSVSLPGWGTKRNSVPSIPLTSLCSSPFPWPSILLLIPFRNEARNLPVLIAALEQLDYPAAQMTIAFIDDGSTDNGRAICMAALQQNSRWQLLILPHNIGKAAALASALTQLPPAPFIAVYDADDFPTPDALKQLVATAVHDPQAGAVSGRRAVSNADASPIATYATFENLIHQLVTVQAKEQLQLAPPLLGSNCLYRRTALAEVGGFTAGRLLEDTDLTVRLATAGWRTRFAPQAVSTHTVPTTLTGYWRQHVRWSAGFQDVAQAEAPRLAQAKQRPWLLRLELLLFSLGYLDRLALLATALVTSTTRDRWLKKVLLVTLLTPLMQLIAILYREQAPLSVWLRLPWMPLFLLLDIAAVGYSSWQKWRGRVIPWETRPPP